MINSHSTGHLMFKKDGSYVPSLKVNVSSKYRRYLNSVQRALTCFCGVHRQRKQANVNMKALSFKAFMLVSFDSPSYSAAQTQRSLAEPQFTIYILGHIKQPFLLKSHMHACFSIR